MATTWTIAELVLMLVNEPALTICDKARLISVNGMFWAATAPHVWADVAGRRLGTLIGVTMDESIEEERPASTTDRFSLYAPFVKTLGLTMRDNSRATANRDAFLQLLRQHGSLAAVLPNVQHLRLNICRSPELLELLVIPTLIQIEYDFWTNEDLMAFLLAVRTASPVLQSLKLKLHYTYLDPIQPLTMQVLAEVVEFQEKLEHLDIKHVPRSGLPAVVRAAQNLPLLKTVSFCPYTEPITFENAWPAIRSLTLDRTEPEAVASLVQTLPAGELETLDIQMPWSAVRSIDDVLPHLQRFTNLRTLRLRNPCFHFTSSWRIIQFIKTCSSLTCLEIWGQASEVSDRAIEVLAKAMPNLQVLKILEGRRGLVYEEWQKPTATLHALQILAHHSSSLRHLSIWLDARWNALKREDTQPIPNSALEEMDLLASPADDNYELVGDLIRNLFPNLRRCEASLAGNWKNSKTDDQNLERWNLIWARARHDPSIA